MNKSITIFIFFLIVISIGALISQHNYMSYIFKYKDYNLTHISNSLSSSKDVFGKYIFEDSNKWNSSIPFNYFLFKDKESQFYESNVNHNDKVWLENKNNECRINDPKICRLQVDF